jgi:hypothetical protein
MPDTPTLKAAGTDATDAVMPQVKPRTMEFSLAESKWARIRRHVPSAEQLASFFRTLVWVAPLTLLIWVYAEREQTVTVPAPPFPIEVKTAAPNRLVKLRGPADGNLVAEFSGPRAKIDRVKELLLPKPDGAAIQIFIDPQLSEGPQELLAVSQLNNHPIFKNNGITVKSCQPPYLKVDIDKYEDRDLPVAIDDLKVLALVTNPQFSPPTIKVRAPSQMFEQAGNSKMYVAAQINPDQLRNRTGTVTLENVPIVWHNFKDNVLYSNPMVKAALTMKQADETYTIAALPVNQTLPPGLDAKYRVEYTDSITNVEVTGPPGQIDLIRKEPNKYVSVSFKVDAFAKEGEDQKSVKLDFKLPAGVSLTAKMQPTVDNWSYKLVKRE